MMTWITNLIGIGRMTRVDDSGELQVLQVTEGAAGDGFADRVTDGIPRVAEFGFASAPPIDAEVLVLRRNGDRSRSIAIGTSHRPSRLRDLKPGDVGIYDLRGAKVMLTADGLMIDCAGLPAILQNCTTLTIKATDRVVLDTPIVEITGDATVAGHSLTKLHDAYAAHKHTGVSTGSGTSAGTDTPAS